MPNQTRPGIVVGSAPCLHDDLAEALELYPDAYVLLVNGACVAVEHAHAILAGHTNKAEIFAQARKAVFPDREVEIFANCNQQHLSQYRLDYPSVTRWFGLEMSTGATSAGKAVRMLLSLGYKPVVMCGCPLDDSGYFPGESQKGVSVGHDCRRVGDPAMDNHRTIRNYRNKFRKLAEGEFKGRVFSMGGLTRELLGAPPGADEW